MPRSGGRSGCALSTGGGRSWVADLNYGFSFAPLNFLLRDDKLDCFRVVCGDKVLLSDGIAEVFNPAVEVVFVEQLSSATFNANDNAA